MINRSEMMIAELLLLYGTWAILNGSYSYVRDEKLEEFAHRLVITWGIITVFYGVNLLLNLW